MSDRKDSFTGQLVTQQFFDECFDQVEDADRAMTADSGFTGIYSGFGVVQHAGTPDLTVDVGTGGVAYAPGGERMRSALLERIDCSIDRDGISTTVTGNTHSRIVSIIVRPDRVLSDPQTDASNATVYVQRTESYVIEVIQGSEADIPSAPAIPAGSILLCDITFTYGMTQILNAGIATSGSAARRQDAFLLTGSPFYTRSGTAKAAMQDIATRYNNHVNGAIDQHDGGDVVYGGSGFWADGSSTVSAGPMDGAISEVVSDLASTGTSDAGEQRIGCESDTSIVGDPLGAQTLKSRLRTIRFASHIYYGGAPSWADSSSGPAAGPVEDAIDAIVSTLAASTGAQKMGMAAVGNFTAGTVQAMIAQLAATTSSNDGAKRVGAQAVAGSYTAGTVRSQLDEVVSGTQTITGAKTFDDLTFSGSTWPKVASRTVYREVTLRVAACSTDSGVNDASVKKSDLTSTIHSLTYYGDMIETSLDNAGGRWHTVLIDKPLDGNVLTAIELETKVAATGGGAVTQAKYDVVRYKVGTGGMTMQSLLSGSLVTDDHTDPTNGTIRTQVVACDQNNTVDATQYRYAVVVQQPYFDDAKLRIYEIRAKYTATTLRSA